jgi:hypothetical protein
VKSRRQLSHLLLEDADVLPQFPVLAHQLGAVRLDVLEPGFELRNPPLTPSVPGRGSSRDGHETLDRLDPDRSPAPHPT